MGFTPKEGCLGLHNQVTISRMSYAMLTYVNFLMDDINSDKKVIQILPIH